MSYDQTHSRDHNRDDSSDIYQSTDTRQLRGPGNPGEPVPAPTPDGGIQGTPTPPSTIGDPLPIVTELDGIVEQFRNRQVSKPRAIGLISSKLAFATTHAEPDKDNAFLQYLTTLDSIERLTADATHRGATIQPDHSQTIHGTAAHQTDQSNRSISGGESREHAIDAVSEEVEGRKRDRGGEEHGHTESRGEDEEAEGASSKRPRILEKNMPWFNRESMARITANPSCIATRDLLSQFAADYYTVKQWILCSQSAPRGFPSTEWDHIIRGKPVDLNVVLSSLHHVYPVTENTGRVGSTEISLGRTEPTRKVNTSGEWTSAWNATADAYVFTFPHRADEIKRYGAYINREFSSKVVSAHRKVILYDTAVRNEVAGGSSILLTDRAEFSHIYSAIVLPDGIESEPGQDSSKSTTKTQTDICRRFNSPNGCPNSSSACRYQHRCSKCRRRGHPSHECEKDKGAGAKSTS